MAGYEDAVKDNALLVCNQGATPSMLRAMQATTKVILAGGTQATVHDHVAGRNIQPFGICRLTQKPCLPQTPAPWQPGLSGIEIAGSKALGAHDTLRCVLGGTIRVLQSGQTTVKLGRNRPMASRTASGQRTRPTAIKSSASEQHSRTNHNTQITKLPEQSIPAALIPFRRKRLIIIPGRVPYLLGGWGAWGDPEKADLKSGDMPDLTFGEAVKVTMLLGLGQHLLMILFPHLAIIDAFGSVENMVNERNAIKGYFIQVMQRELVGLAHNMGLKMLDRFLQGTGAQFNHDPDSVLGKLAASSFSIYQALATVKGLIEQQLTRQAATGIVRLGSLHIAADALPRIQFNFLDNSKLVGTIEGVQGLEIFVTQIEANADNRSYRATLCFKMYDHFGVDKSDLYSPSLAAFWVLQHYYVGPKAFVNRIIINKVITGSF